MGMLCHDWIILHDYLRGPWAGSLNRRPRCLFFQQFGSKIQVFAHFRSCFGYFGDTVLPQAPAEKHSSWRWKQGVQMPFRRQHREGPRCDGKIFRIFFSPVGCVWMNSWNFLNSVSSMTHIIPNGRTIHPCHWSFSLLYIFVLCCLLPIP